MYAAARLDLARYGGMKLVHNSVCLLVSLIFLSRFRFSLSARVLFLIPCNGATASVSHFCPHDLPLSRRTRPADEELCMRSLCYVSRDSLSLEDSLTAWDGMHGHKCEVALSPPLLTPFHATVQHRSRLETSWLGLYKLGLTVTRRKTFFLCSGMRMIFFWGKLDGSIRGHLESESDMESSNQSINHHQQQHAGRGKLSRHPNHTPQKHD